LPIPDSLELRSGFTTAWNPLADPLKFGLITVGLIIFFKAKILRVIKDNFMYIRETMMIIKG